MAPAQKLGRNLLCPGLRGEKEGGRGGKEGGRRREKREEAVCLFSVPRSMPPVGTFVVSRENCFFL